MGENAIRVANNTSQHEILNIPVRLKAHLAARKTRVRQTIGNTVQKHTPQNQKNQVKNSLVRIVLSPGENGGPKFAPTHRPGPVAKIKAQATAGSTQRHENHTGTKARFASLRGKQWFFVSNLETYDIGCPGDPANSSRTRYYSILKEKKD